MSHISPRYVTACRIVGCLDIAVTPSTMCFRHIQRGRAALGFGYEKGELFHNKRWTNLYAIKAGAFVKFGVADDVERRRLEMQIGCPLELQVCGAIEVPYEIEAAVHKALSSLTVRGEWFRWEEPSLKIAEAIRNRDYEKLSALIVPRGTTRTGADVSPSA